MRYLGRVTELTTMPSIRSLCIWEMIARSLKRMFNFELTNFILMAGNSVSDAEENLHPAESPQTKQLLQKFEESLKLVAFRFLNKVFGKFASPVNNNKEFWGIEIYKQVEKDFDY